MPTIQELQDRRAAYLAAERRILDSQEYKLSDANGGGRSNRRADLEQVRLAIADLDIQIERAQSQATGRGRVLYIR